MQLVHKSKPDTSGLDPTIRGGAAGDERVWSAQGKVELTSFVIAEVSRVSGSSPKTTRWRGGEVRGGCGLVGKASSEPPSSDRFATTFSHQGRRVAECVEAAEPTQRAPFSPGGRRAGDEGGAELATNVKVGFQAGLADRVFPPI